MEPPPQSLSQQTSSMQKPLKHSSGLRHEDPLGFPFCTRLLRTRWALYCGDGSYFWYVTSARPRPSPVARSAPEEPAETLTGTGNGGGSGRPFGPSHSTNTPTCSPPS